MVTQMTRSEYETKYGKPPTAAPVRMTRAQYEETYKKPAPTKVDFSKIEIAPSTIGSRLKAENAKSQAQRAVNVTKIADETSKGNQGFLRGAFQTGGEMVGSVVDPFVNAAKSLPGARAVGKGLSWLTTPIRAGVNKAADKLSDTKFFQEAAAAGDELPIERDIKATLEYANILPGPKGGKAIVKSAAAGGDIAMAGGKAVADTTKAAVEKTAAPFAKDFLPARKAAFDREGIVPPVSAISKSPFVQGAEAVAAKSAFGREVVDLSRRAQAEIERKTNDIVTRITPIKTVSDENLGKTIQEGLREYEHNFKVTEEKVYTDFAKKYGKAETVAENTTDMLGQIINEQGMDFFVGADQRLVRMYERMTGETATVKQMRNDGLPEAVIAAERANNTPELTYNELKETRTSVGEQLARDPENTALKRLYGALAQDLKAAVGKLDKDGLKALQKLDADYKAGKDKIESRIASSIEQSNPERIAQNIVKRNSADTLKTLKEMVGQSRFDEISKVFLRQTFESSYTRGKFDVTKLKGTLDGYDKATLEQIFTPSQYSELKQAVESLDRLKTLQDALQPGKKFAEGSQTAFLQEIKGVGTRIGAIATSLLLGQVGIASALLFGTGLEAAYAKLFTTEAGRRFLTEGLFGNVAQAKKLGEVLKTAPFEKPAVVPIITPKNKWQKYFPKEKADGPPPTERDDTPF